jgi:hypothetical protein
VADVKTVFGSLGDYQKGGVEIISDDPKNYVFSNVFEVASREEPWRRVAVGKNFQYIVEVVRAEGVSPWFAASHDEFALVMDGRVEVQLRKLGPDQTPPESKEGATLVRGEPEGPKMGRLVLGRGHMALLPKGAGYQFRAEAPGVLTIQTIQGELTVEKWAEICLS